MNLKEVNAKINLLINSLRILIFFHYFGEFIQIVDFINNSLLKYFFERGAIAKTSC